MRNKRFFTGIAIAIILAGSVLVNVSQGVAASQLTDIEHHWAASHIQTMIDEGMVSGYPDHTFKPDNAVNRAEFVTLVNHVFHFTAIAATGFLDVAATDWFAEEIAKAKSAGYLNGYEDGTVKPGQRITRQEAAVMIARAVGLEAGSAQELAGFQDAGEIPAWSQGALAALVGRDCIKGYPDGTIQAGKTVSRAEAAVMLHKAAAYAATSPAQQPIGSDWSNLDKAGSYGPASGQQEVSSDVIITAADVTLQNVIIQGDLLISAAVGNGDVTLQKVTVTGTATIEGGGEDTVTIDNCVLGQTIINKAGGKVRLCLSGNTIIAELVARSGVKVEGQARIDKAVIRSANVVIETQPGSSEIASGLSASVGGKTVSARRSGGSGGSSANANIPAEVESMVVNELLGNTYVTVNLKADAAEARTRY